jgi:regulation of enolase protein 1 (concanavalin A-like superfamily)
MKKTAIIAFAIAATACGSAPTNTANTSAPPANRPAANAVVNSNANSNSNAAPATGVKVTAPSDHKFGTEGIPKGWKWIDAEAATKGAVKYDTSGGALKFVVPSGKDMFGDNRTAPHMIQPIEGDFQIETRVKFDPKSDYQGAGLFIYIDGNNYVRLERAFGGLNGGESGIRLDARTGGDYRPVTSPSEVPTNTKSVDLKILRTGKILYAFWRIDENAEWKEIGDVEYDFPATVQAGIIACNTSAEIPVEFSYIKLAPAV